MGAIGQSLRPTNPRLMDATWRIETGTGTGNNRPTLSSGPPSLILSATRPYRWRFNHQIPSSFAASNFEPSGFHLEFHFQLPSFCDYFMFLFCFNILSANSLNRSTNRTALHLQQDEMQQKKTHRSAICISFCQKNWPHCYEFSDVTESAGTFAGRAEG